MQTIRADDLKVWVLSLLFLGLTALSPVTAGSRGLPPELCKLFKVTAGSSGPPLELCKLFQFSDAVAIMAAKPSENDPKRLSLVVQNLYKEGPEPFNSQHALKTGGWPGLKTGAEFLECYSSTANQSTRDLIPLVLKTNADGSKEEGIWFGDPSAGKPDFVPVREIDLWFKKVSSGQQ